MVGVGTMNYMHTPEQIANGILEIVKTCHEKQPQAEILIMVCRAHYFYSLCVLDYCTFCAAMHTRLQVAPDLS